MKRDKNIGQFSTGHKRQLVEPLLRRVFRFGNESLQEKSADLIATILCSLVSGLEPLDGAKFDLIEFILDENHPIFNYRLSRNNQILMKALCDLRNPDSEQRNKE